MERKMRFTEPMLASKISLIGVLVSLHLTVVRPFCPAQDIGNRPPGPPPLECPASNGDRIGITVDVLDKSGHPLAGLEAADFKIFDNNQPQKILAFDAVDSAHPSAVPLSVRIIIDAVNSGPVVVAQERDGVSAFLKQNSGRLADPISIWILANDGLTRIAGPSQDSAVLLDALNRAQPRLRVIDRSAGVWGDTERTGQAIKLLKEMVSPESTTSGRKLVLFLSPGWPMLLNYEPDQRKWVFDDIVSISNGLRDSCTSLNIIIPSFETGNYDSFLKGITKIADAQYADLSLQVLSEHSGGQVIVGGNDIKDEISNTLRDAATYYYLSFETASGHRGTEYHAIRVAVNRSHVKPRTTAGYYVVGP